MRPMRSAIALCLLPECQRTNGSCRTTAWRAATCDAHIVMRRSSASRSFAEISGSLVIDVRRLGRDRAAGEHRERERSVGGVERDGLRPRGAVSAELSAGAPRRAHPNQPAPRPPGPGPTCPISAAGRRCPAPQTRCKTTNPSRDQRPPPRRCLTATPGEATPQTDLPFTHGTCRSALFLRAHRLPSRASALRHRPCRALHPGLGHRTECDLHTPR
jgi:hypothetical protein